MNRLEILILDRRNGVITSEHVDVPSAISFFRRSGHAHRFSIVAHKGKQALYFDKIDPSTIERELNEFAVQQ